MEKLREKLHKSIDKYGALDKRTIAISKELDKKVCKTQTSLFKNYK